MGAVNLETIHIPNSGYDYESEEGLYLLDAASGIEQICLENNCDHVLLVERSSSALIGPLRDRIHNNESSIVVVPIDPFGFYCTYTGIPHSELFHYIRKGAAEIEAFDFALTAGKTHKSIGLELLRLIPTIEESNGVMVVDVCTHTGDTINPILRVLNVLGVENSHVTIINHAETENEILLPKNRVHIMNLTNSCYLGGEEHTNIGDFTPNKKHSLTVQPLYF